VFPGDLTVSALSGAMRGLGLRQQAYSQNIANAETPGYRRVDVSFEGALADAVAQDRGQGIGADPRFAGGGLGGTTSATDAVQPATSTDDSTMMRADGSSVDPDTEMAGLAANQLAYQTVTALLAKRFGQLAYVINGR
jgi:flagellar basal-body rod protein FlgB